MSEPTPTWKAASRDRHMFYWRPAKGQSADTDNEPEREDVISRSRDAFRNEPIARAAIQRPALNAVGTGLRAEPSVDWRALGITEEAAEIINEQIEAEWRLFAHTQDFSLDRELNFAQLQYLSFESMLTNGDALLNAVQSRPTRDRPYSTAFQLIEADRICNANNQPDTTNLCGGAEKDAIGATVAFHIASHHPGGNTGTLTWQRLPVFGQKTGRRLVMHIKNPMQLRPEQSRGMPFIAGILEMLKKRGKWTSAELSRALSQSFFTAFIESPEEDGPLFEADPEYKDWEQKVSTYNQDTNFKLGDSTILSLLPGDKVNFPPLSAPNPAHDKFSNHLIQEIGASLGLPAEVIMGYFSSSYSAARAALNEAWALYLFMRSWFTNMMPTPVYSLFLDEAVARGRLNLPGYNDDPIKRAAYARVQWIALIQRHMDEEKAARAAEKRIQTGISTRRMEAEAMGHDFHAIERQRKKEQASEAPQAPAPTSPAQNLSNDELVQALSERANTMNNIELQTLMEAISDGGNND